MRYATRSWFLLALSGLAFVLVWAALVAGCAVVLHWSGVLAAQVPPEVQLVVPSYRAYCRCDCGTPGSPKAGCTCVKTKTCVYAEAKC